MKYSIQKEDRHGFEMFVIYANGTELTMFPSLNGAISRIKYFELQERIKLALRK